MTGLVPTVPIHMAIACSKYEMPGTRPGMTER